MRRPQSAVTAVTTVTAVTRSAATLLLLGMVSYGSYGCGDQLAPEFAEGSGAPPARAGTYPDPPYGLTVGATIPNWSFRGYPTADSVDDPPRFLSLADFYNPTGDGVFQEGSPYAGQAKPRVLLVAMGGAWCPPCQLEAEDVFPPLYEELKPQGLEIIFLLMDSFVQNVQPTMADLRTWSNQFNITYPLGLDLQRHLMDVMPQAAYPGAAIVWTRDMRILKVEIGIISDDSYALIRSLLAGDDTCDDNGQCDPGETAATCAGDCGGDPVCGNGVCQQGEDSVDCPDDCRAPMQCTDLATATSALGPCDSGEADQCLCEGCIDDGVCADPDTGNIDDCVCPDCTGDAYCNNLANCNYDGACDPYREGCGCSDCAAHPQCY